ncbi:paraquat-inducible protein A [Acidimangrovimonas sediminis]|uniref:paraquat-inducible protein A n=1 Tax=Acidimangrovimonas sediminis TaxID=2056283 RepID=UPI001E5E1AEE|nr:paraquat-inducible protein A [Acidimangrovimonas sediminis]
MLTARRAGLVGCRSCGRVWPRQQRHCGRCGGHLDDDRGASLQRVWAWLIAGVIFYVPANLYPMLDTASLLTGDVRNTIVGGVIELVHAHDYGVAAIVFAASVVVPITKFLAIAQLALTLGRVRPWRRHRRHRMLAVVDFIGRWSMIDVFVVAILSSLVQLGSLAQVHPGPAAIFFALSVVFTMLAAQAFDPRLIWERDEAEAA